MKRVIKVCTTFLFVLVMNSVGIFTIQAQDIPSLIKDAENGDAESQYLLGKSYIENLNNYDDRSNACKWLRKAAFQNHQKALVELCINLGGKYLEGDISLPNDADYMYWMIKSHELGFSPSFCFLGYAFMEGIPTLKVERNYPKALYYFQDYWVYRPALEEGKVHWWEDQSLSEKFASLWDLGYEPCSTNEKPAQLQVIPNSVKVSDNGNIVAGGKVYVTLQVKNVGMGDSDFSIVLSEISDNSGLSIPVVSIPLISPGETKSIVIPVTGQNKLRNGNIPISFKVCDPRGSETVPVDIVLHAHVK